MCSPNACNGVFNPNVPIFQSNCAEGLQFSGFFHLYILMNFLCYNEISKMAVSSIIHRYPGTKTTCLNLGSYNYLGFAENTGPCADAAYQCTLQYGAGTSSPRRELGMNTPTVTPMQCSVI